MKIPPPKLYKQYFIDRDFERLGLFKLLAEKYGIERALYPGSFAHITPSFVFPSVVYVDSDKPAKKFFEDASLQAFIDERKIYPQKAKFTFHAQDYQNEINEPEQSFDLVISQYAGFVSQFGKRYLKIGGLVLANNSHGDASMMRLDKDYQFVAVADQNKGKYRLSEKDLDAYFIPKSKAGVTKEYLEKTQRGVGYKKSADVYIFKRIK